MQLRGGRIWVESEVGVGTTFHVEATFDVAAEAAVPAADQLAREPDARQAAAHPGLHVLPAGESPARQLRPRVRILLAEDNIVNQHVAVGLLTNRGHQVTVVNNGIEAIEAFERGTFDVVLMDVQMPEMGGYEATAAIRAIERRTGGHVRIVAITAHALNGDRERCLAAGMDDYVSKPIERSALFQAVEGGSPRLSSVAGATCTSTFDRGQLLARVGGDEKLMRDVTQLFLTEFPKRLAAIESAVADADAERLRVTAHALKGMAGTLSAGAVMEIACELETFGRNQTLDAAGEALRRLETEARQLVRALESDRSLGFRPRVLPPPMAVAV